MSAIDRGWYNQAGDHIPTNINYQAGDNGSGTSINEVRNFFLFDLSALEGEVLSASFTVFTDSYSADSFEDYYLYEVSTTIPALMAGGSGQTQIFNDLRYYRKLWIRRSAS